MPCEVEWVRQQVAMTTSSQLQQLLGDVLKQMRRSRLYAYTSVKKDTKEGYLTAKKADEAWRMGEKQQMKLSFPKKRASNRDVCQGSHVFSPTSYFYGGEH